MKTIKFILLSASLVALPLIASAAEKMVTLDVNNMTCMSCPYQVKSALKQVVGVTAATASLDTQQAVVTYDDTVTNVALLMKATSNAGYPSYQAQDTERVQ
jgi:mercuric ion binding protein